MPEDKKEVLLSSIRRLVSLEVPESQIVLNLQEIGLPEQEAVQLVAQVLAEQKQKICIYLTPNYPT